MKNRFSDLVNAARILFTTKGYANVGMREIALKAGCSPMQAYRMGLAKEDLLAEISICLSNEQLEQIAANTVINAGEEIYEFTIKYLTYLYERDIKNINIRRETAAYGWMWSTKYEERIITQVFGLLKPIIEALTTLGYDQVEARCMGIWSLYYVGFRNAVVHGHDAHICVDSISPSLKLLLIK